MLVKLISCVSFIDFQNNRQCLLLHYKYNCLLSHWLFAHDLWHWKRGVGGEMWGERQRRGMGGWEGWREVWRSGSIWCNEYYSQSSFLHTISGDPISVCHYSSPVFADKESAPQKADGLFRWQQRYQLPESSRLPQYSWKRSGQWIHLCSSSL